MKKLSASFFFVLLALATTLPASAQTIRRVSLTVTGANIYADFASAQTAAAAGDIIQIEPGNYPSMAVNLTKNLTVVGPGYFLDQYTGASALQANTTPATVNNIQFSAGSTGASVSGLTANDVYFSASGVSLQRCRVTSNVYISYITNNLTNLNIRQNFIGAIGLSSPNATNVLITNNIIGQGFRFSTIVNLPTTMTGEFVNNTVVTGAVNVNGMNVRNNYFGSGDYVPNLAGSSVSFNASARADFPTTGNNQNNVSNAAVWVSTAGTHDANYQLRAGTNVLRGTGENGVDIGAFGGNSPHKLGGLPAIPAIYQLSNSVNGNTLNVNLSTRSNN